MIRRDRAYPRTRSTTHYTHDTWLIENGKTRCKPSNYFEFSRISSIFSLIISLAHFDSASIRVSRPHCASPRAFSVSGKGQRAGGGEGTGCRAASSVIYRQPESRLIDRCIEQSAGQSMENDKQTGLFTSFGVSLSPSIPLSRGSFVSHCLALGAPLLHGSLRGYCPPNAARARERPSQSMSPRASPAIRSSLHAKEGKKHGGRNSQEER